MPDEKNESIAPSSSVRRIAPEKFRDMVKRGEVQILNRGFDLVQKEKKAWETFLGKKLETPIPHPPQELLATMEKAKEIGWTQAEAHFLPKMELKQNSDISEWTVRPENWYWQDIKEGKAANDVATLPGIWIIVDGSQKPPYVNGKRMYENDPFAHILAQLRKEGKIEVPDWCRNIPEGSRFGISHDEIRAHVNPAIATLLGVHPEQVRLPKAIEFNILGNLAHPEWGKTDVWEWFQDTFEDGHRLFGGSSDFSGLANVRDHASGAHDGGLGFRPLVAFPFDYAQGKPSTPPRLRSV